MIRVIAVDDEPLALKQLESYISKIPFFEHAVEGFRVDAVDYLLKPFSLADFMKTAERVKARWEALQVLSQPKRLAEMGKAEVKLEDGTVLPVGDAYRQGLKGYLDKHSF